MGVRRTFRFQRAVALAGAAVLVVLWVIPALAQECPEVVFLRVGDKKVIIGWRLPQDEHDVWDEHFGGYRVWMKEVWAEDEFSLVREYILDEPEGSPGYWHFPAWYLEEPVVVTTPTGMETLRGVRRDSAEIFQNAFPYEFSVTAFTDSTSALVDTFCRRVNNTGIVYPREGVQTDLRRIQAIPNPYRAGADWEHGGQRRIAFVGLPKVATIRIYTTAADLVRTLHHDSPQSDLEFWDLKTTEGDEVAPGVYIWAVDAEGIGNAEGRMLIIK